MKKTAEVFSVRRVQLTANGHTYWQWKVDGRINGVRYRKHFSERDQAEGYKSEMEIKTLNENGVRLRAIGDISRLPEKSRKTLLKAIEDTSQNARMTLVLALNYSAKWEIVEAAKKLAAAAKSGEIDPADIDEDAFANALSTSGIPDPELLIRTSGENRISNFLLWQIAYAELYFTPTLWPDFRRDHLYQAIIDFQNRERRFGKTSEQLV